MRPEPPLLGPEGAGEIAGRGSEGKHTVIRREEPAHLWGGAVLRAGKERVTKQPPAHILRAPRPLESFPQAPPSHPGARLAQAPPLDPDRQALLGPACTPNGACARSRGGAAGSLPAGVRRSDSGALPEEAALLCSWWQSRRLASPVACVATSQKVEESSHCLSQGRLGASQAVQGWGAVRKMSWLSGGSALAMTFNLRSLESAFLFLHLHLKATLWVRDLQPTPK